MIKKTLAVLTIMLIAGCSSKPLVVPKPIIHPNWPDPIAEYSGNWQVKTIDGKAWVGMPFEESQEFRIWLNDVSRYVKDANGMICYYRKDLKEQRCL
ncbi:o-spanin [Citrobacter phage CkP1]|nr:o-spanin [Citrobacter phage CkP1]